MAIEDRNLTVGTRLVANYRRQAHACMVEKGDEGGGILFVLEDGRKFKSASAAASAVMGGKAVNGWRFWSLLGAPQPTSSGGQVGNFALEAWHVVADHYSLLNRGNEECYSVLLGRPPPERCVEGDGMASPCTV